MRPERAVGFRPGGCSTDGSALIGSKLQRGPALGARSSKLAARMNTDKISGWSAHQRYYFAADLDAVRDVIQNQADGRSVVNRVLDIPLNSLHFGVIYEEGLCEGRFILTGSGVVGVSQGCALGVRGARLF
jgi:hypothetical protein